MKIIKGKDISETYQKALYELQNAPIVNNTREIRATLNLSQVELAEMLDVSFASVNRWENGKYEPTRLVKEKIRLICKQHNIEMEAKECN